MSFEQTFLESILADSATHYDRKRISEAVSPDDREDGIVDGFNIPLDAQARALSAKVKMPIARRLVSLFSMSGVPGRYLNAEEAEGSILAATDMLRKKATTRKAFLDFYNALATTKGYATPEDKGALGEAKNHLGDTEYQTYAAWKRAAKVIDPNVWFEGDKDIGQAMTGANPFVKGKSMAIGEWDGEKGSIFTTAKEDVAKLKSKIKEAVGDEDDTSAGPGKAKRGNYMQKLFSEVLIELGLPGSLTTATAAPAVQAGLLKTSAQIADDAGLERALRTLALRMGIKADDVQSKVSEAVEVGQDVFANEVVNLAVSLGIPEAILNLRRPQLIQALRAKKMSLKNRATIQTRMRQLQDIINKNTVEAGKGDPDSDK